MTVHAALHRAGATLSPSPTSSLDAQLLLGHVLGKERSWILAHRDEPLLDECVARFEDLISQRASGVPVAYLRGYCEWFGLTLKVTPHVLVPRPETELLVEEAVHIARKRRAATLVDVGTGSGAIAIQLSRSLPHARITGIDISSEALKVARHNAAATGTGHRITWLEGNLLCPLRSEPDLLVANLPYLSERMMSTVAPEVNHEPILALFAGATGLELYSELFQLRHERGWTMPMVLEIDPRQWDDLSRMLRTKFSEAGVRVLRDYADLERIVVVGA